MSPPLTITKKEIRIKQKKGSKEARDIVAMLAREYRAFLNDSLRVNLFKESRKRIREANKHSTSVRYWAYQKAKGMLK